MTTISSQNLENLHGLIFLFTFFSPKDMAKNTEAYNNYLRLNTGSQEFKLQHLMQTIIMF